MQRRKPDTRPRRGDLRRLLEEVAPEASRLVRLCVHHARPGARPHVPAALHRHRGARAVYCERADDLDPPGLGSGARSRAAAAERSGGRGGARRRRPHLAAAQHERCDLHVQRTRAGRRPGDRGDRSPSARQGAQAGAAVGEQPRTAEGRCDGGSEGGDVRFDSALKDTAKRGRVGAALPHRRCPVREQRAPPHLEGPFRHFFCLRSFLLFVCSHIVLLLASPPRRR